MRLGGPEVIEVPGGRALQFTEEALRRFYLEHLLVHEVGHLVDSLRPGRPRHACSRCYRLFCRNKYGPRAGSTS